MSDSPDPAWNEGEKPGRAPTMEARTEERVALGIVGPKLRQRGGSLTPVKLFDMSATGFRAEWPYMLERDEMVWLKIDGLELLTAKVAWHQGFIVGCHFERKLHPAIFHRVIESLKR